jgi:p21-activated kinase 1
MSSSRAKITVEYHRPSRESIRELNALIADSTLYAAQAARYTSLLNSPPMAAPTRPSRANTANLNDIFPPDVIPSASQLAARRQSIPEQHFSPHPRSRSATTSTKPKKGVLGFMSEVFNTSKRPEISTPYDPVHLTHVGFNSSTGEFTGLPKEWQQLLQESGISRQEQEKNPQAVMEIVKFYQEGPANDVWDKLGAVDPVDDFRIPVRMSPALPTRLPPPPPKKPSPPGSTVITGPTPYRPAPTPPSIATPALDRSTSQRIPPRPAKPLDALGRANTTRDRRSPGPPSSVPAAIKDQATQPPSKPSPGSSATDLPLKSRDPRAVSTSGQNSTAQSNLAKVSGVATPRKRTKDKTKDEDIIKRLQAICTDADPTKLYRNLVKIGQG